MSPHPLRILVAGATGTIGRAVVEELVRRGHDVVCFVRPTSSRAGLPPECDVRAGDVLDPASVLRDGFRGQRFHAVVSAMASRSGAPDDARPCASVNVTRAANTLARADRTRPRLARRGNGGMLVT